MLVKFLNGLKNSEPQPPGRTTDSSFNRKLTTTKTIQGYTNLKCFRVRLTAHQLNLFDQNETKKRKIIISKLKNTVPVTVLITVTQKRYFKIFLYFAQFC